MLSGTTDFSVAFTVTLRGALHPAFMEGLARVQDELPQLRHLGGFVLVPRDVDGVLGGNLHPLLDVIDGESKGLERRVSVARPDEERGESELLHFAMLGNVTDDGNGPGGGRLEDTERAHVSETSKRDENVADRHEIGAYLERNLFVEQGEARSEPSFGQPRAGDADVLLRVGATKHDEVGRRPLSGQIHECLQGD